MPKPDFVRFLESADISEGCWEWKRGKGKKGYGMFRINGRPVSAHRAAFEFFFGEIPEGLQVLHRCDNRGCVNPSHLFLGTNMDNMLDKIQKGRQLHGEQIAQSKLTKDQVLKIFSEKGPQSVIAARYGINPSQVSRIKGGRRWARATMHLNSGGLQ